jgi:hypothetical protein
MSQRTIDAQSHASNSWQARGKLRHDPWMCTSGMTRSLLIHISPIVASTCVALLTGGCSKSNDDDNDGGFDESCADGDGSGLDCPAPLELVMLPCATCGQGMVPFATSVGGTQQLALYDPNAGDPPVDPFVAKVTSGNALAVTATAGSTLTVAGDGLGSSTVTVVDAKSGAILVQQSLETATLTSASFVPSTGESSTNAIAFAAGPLTVGLMLYGSDLNSSLTLVADSSLTITGWPGATQPMWDSLQGTATVGTYTLTLTSGAVALPLSLVIVDHADEIVPAVVPVESDAINVVCFAAETAGLTVVGLAWTFSTANTALGVMVQPDNEFPDCADVGIPAGVTAPISVTASAGGASVTQTYAYESE